MSTRREYGEALLESIMQTFESAYRDHAMRGLSEEALLITHDIFAAAWEGDPRTPESHRKAIRSACNACDSGVPLAEARAYMRVKLQRKLEALLKADVDNN
jgi:hypothetical protein